MGKIQATQEKVASRTVETQVTDNDGTIKDDLAKAIEVSNQNGRIDNVSNQGIAVHNTTSLQESNKMETEVDVDKLYNDDNFDAKSLAILHARTKVASLVIGSFCISFSGIPNMMANFSQASKIFARCIGKCCLYASEADRRDGNNNNGCCCMLMYCIAQIYSGVAWILEKISKFLLQFCAKPILTTMALKNIDYFAANKQIFKIIHENKSTFQASKMIVLDSAISQHLTHLILCCSSLGAWCSIWIGYGEYAPLIHCAGYLAGRTAFEMIEVLIQLWLVIWSLDPILLGGQPVLKNVVEMILNTQDGNKSREEIVRQLELEWQVNKVANSDGSVNTAFTQTVAYQIEQDVLTVEKDQAVCQQKQQKLVPNDRVHDGGQTSALVANGTQ